MTTASPIADRPAAESVYVIPSRTHPFKDYRCNPVTGKCSCPAKPGTCWHLALAKASRASGVPVNELLYRLRRARNLGGCAKETCLWCLGLRARFYCPGSQQGRAAWSRMVIEEEIRRGI